MNPHTRFTHLARLGARHTLLRVLGIVLAVALPAGAHAQSLVGGTIVLRVSDEFYDYYTSQGGTFAPEGLAQAVPGDPQTFLLPSRRVTPVGPALLLSDLASPCRWTNPAAEPACSAI